MELLIKILRRDNPTDAPYYQTFQYDGAPEDSVATILRSLNEQDALCDLDGKQAKRITWECGCMQRRCGACAMRVNGMPRLACSSFAGDLVGKGSTILLEPLSKFPVIADLAVDKSTLFESMLDMKLWLEEDAHLSGWTHEQQFESGRCLMCGCCLEVCPSFLAGGQFSGAIGAVNGYRFFEQSQHNKHRNEMVAEYRKRYFEGCGKSLSCHNICPIKLPVEELLVRSNAMAAWRQ